MLDIFNVNINIAKKFDFFTEFVVHLRIDRKRFTTRNVHPCLSPYEILRSKKRKMYLLR